MSDPPNYYSAPDNNSTEYPIEYPPQYQPQYQTQHQPQYQQAPFPSEQPYQPENQVIEPLYQSSSLLVSYQNDSESNPNPNVSLLVDVDHNDFENCSICLSRMEQVADTRQTICGHVFHKACIETWMQYNATCPFCRSVLVPDFPQMRIFANDNDRNNQNNQNNIIVEPLLMDYLPYRCVCGSCQCCYFQISNSTTFMMNIRLLFMLILLYVLFNECVSWTGTPSDYITVILGSILFLYNLWIQILMRFNLRFENCRLRAIVSIQ